MSQRTRASGWNRDIALWVALGGAVLTAVLAFEWSRQYQHNVCDDALISFQYARNAAEGLGFVFNPGERVEGFTNFLWTALLAFAYPLSDGTSGGFVRVGIAISIAFAAVAVFLQYRLGRIIWPGRVAPIALSIGLCVLDNSYTVWAIQALESHLLICLMLLSCIFLWGGRGTFHVVGAACSLAAAMMTRPDAALFVAVLGVSELVWVFRADDRKRALVRVVSIFGATALLYGWYFLWRYEYFGYFFPNTYYVKAAGLRGDAIERGLDYARWFLFDRAYVPLLALGAIAGIRHRIIGPLLAWCMVHVAYVVYVGGDFYPGHRFFVVLIPFAAILSAFALDRVASTFHSWWPAARWLRGGVWLVGLSLLALLAARGITHGPIEHEVRRWGDEVARTRALMEWLGAHAPAGASIAAGDIGASGYYTGLYVHDLFGIIDPVIAHRAAPRFGSGKAGHEKRAEAGYILGKRPTYIKRGYLRQDLYRHGYFFESSFPDDLDEPGIWRREVHHENEGWTRLRHTSFDPESIEGWVSTGAAFRDQPVRGPRHRTQLPAGVEGWCISSKQPPTEAGAVGALRSPPFSLVGDVLRVRVGGGRDPSRLRVELRVDGRLVAWATGNDGDILSRYTWDISGHRGRNAELRIVDDATAPGGVIVVDELEQWIRRPGTGDDTK